MSAKALAIFFIFIFAGPLAFAEGDAEREKTASDMQNYRFKTVTTPEGLHFSIPDDMPIETRNGLKGPVPYEEYQYYKMRKLEELMLGMDKKLDRLDKSTHTSLENIQKQLEKISKSTQEKPIEEPIAK